MLMATMEVLRRQRPYVAGHGAYARAYDQGRRFWRAHYGEQLLAPDRAGSSPVPRLAETGAMLPCWPDTIREGSPPMSRAVADTWAGGVWRSRGRQGTRCPEAPPLAQDIEVGAPPRIVGRPNSDVVR